MSKVRQVSFSPDEFIAGTAGLSAAELGVYWFACALIYSTGEAIPQNDDRFRALKSDPRTIRACVAALIEKGKIEVQDDLKMMVRRCRREIEMASRRIQVATENGSRSGRVRGQNAAFQSLEEPNPHSQDELSQSQSQSQSSSSTPIVPKGTVYTQEFDRFWNAWPHKIGKDAAWKAWVKRGGDRPHIDVILLAVIAYEASKPPDRAWCNPATWINQGRWGDQPAERPPTPFDEGALPPIFIDAAAPRWRHHLLELMGQGVYRIWGAKVIACVVEEDLVGKRVKVLCETAFSQHHIALNYAQHFQQIFAIPDHAIKFYVATKERENEPAIHQR